MIGIGTENPADDKPNEGLSAEIRSSIDGYIADGDGLFSDSLHTWLILNGTSNPKYFHVENLITFEHYEERIRRLFTIPASADYILNNSNPIKVKQFNKMIDEFNADLPRIKQENDLTKCREFFNQALQLFNRKKSYPE